MKKLIFILGLFLASNANAATYYFSNSVGGNITVLGDNANQGTYGCSLAHPCRDFKGTTLDNAGAMSPGDIVYLDGGDTWEGTTAEMRIISNGTANNYIKILSYGGGAATLKGTTTYASGWVLCTSGCPANTYYQPSISWTDWNIRTVTQSNTKGLFEYARKIGSSIYTGRGCGGGGCTSAYGLDTLPVGHYFFDASTDRMYVRLWGQENPNTLGTVSIPTFIHSPSGDGLRGLVCTSCENGSYGDYIQIGDENGLNIIGANGVGFSAGGVYNITSHLNIVGAGADGWLAQAPFFAGETGDYAIDISSTVSYSAAAGGGSGQGITTYRRGTLFYKTTSHHNAMAGIDFLIGYISPSYSNTSYGACKFCTVYSNGLWGNNPSYDPNLYIDGANNIFIKDSVFYDGGNGTSGTAADNERLGVIFGAESPSVSPVYNVDFVNNLIYNINYIALGTQNLPHTVDNITGIKVIGNTVIARRGGETNMVRYYNDIGAGTDIVTEKYNIFYAESGSVVDNYASTSTYLDADYNLFYVEGGSSTIYKIGNSTNCTLAQWQSGSGTCGSGEDANSSNSDPKFLSDNQSSFDVHLAHTATGQVSNSPAVNAGPSSHGYTCPSWVYSQWPSYFPECAPGQDPLQGTTRSDSVQDTGNLDLGYHYPIPPPNGPGSLTSANVEPASLETATSGTLTVSFTNQNSWDSDGKLRIVLPSNLGNWSFNSGGSSTASCTSGCNGSLSVSTSTNQIILTRSGGFNIGASTAITINVTNVQNPSSAGTLNSYLLETQTSGGSVIDSNSSVSGDILTAPSVPQVSAYITGGFTFSGNGSF